MKKLLILSGKGGTGKTTIASSFKELSEAKAYADCDVDAPNLHLTICPEVAPIVDDYYGMDKANIDLDKCVGCGECVDNCKFGAISYRSGYIIDLIACEGCGVCERVCTYGAISMINCISGKTELYLDDEVFSTAMLKMGSGNSGLLVTKVKSNLFNNITNQELAILDGPPGIGCPVIASISGVDLVLIVAEPSLSGISDLTRIITTARKLEVKIAVCVNKCNTNVERSHQIKEMCVEFDIPFVGEVPYDESVVGTVNTGASVVSYNCVAGEAIRDVYRKTIQLLYLEGRGR